MSILNLPHWNVLEIKEAESNYLITAEYTADALAYYITKSVELDDRVIKFLKEHT